MPTIPLPLMKGTKTTVNARYDDALPVNMLPVPAETEKATGYLRSFSGIEFFYDAAGFSYGAEYNDLLQKEYRILGEKLTEDGVQVADVVGGKLTNIVHSPNSVCFVDNGTLNYWRDEKLTQIKNWEEGENYVSYPQWKFTPNFNGSSYVKIPAWTNENGFEVGATVYLESLPSVDMFVIASKRTDSNFSGIWYKGSDKKFYIRVTGTTDVELQEAIVGENILTYSSLVKFQYQIELIGAVQKGVAISDFLTGQIYNVSLFDHVNSNIFRKYTQLILEDQEDGVKPDTPTTKVIVNSQDASGITNGTLTGLWTDYHEQGDPVKSPATEFDLEGVLDVDRHKGRYVWINSRRFGCTALTVGAAGNQDTSPEQRPDYVAPFYSPEHDPDDNKAIRSWNNYVVIFGRNSTEFFRLTGNADNLYVPEQSYVVEAGIVSTHAVCEYAGAFAGLGSTKGGTLQVMMISGGKYQKISTSTVDRVINSYPESELKGVLVETVMMDNHNLLFVHLPNETLVFDSNQNAWVTLKSSVKGDDPYRGRHIIYNQKEGLTIGDKIEAKVGKLKDEISSQYDQFVEHILYTPFVQVNQGYGKIPLHRLKFNSIYGHVNVAQSIMISATLDGRTYGREYYLTYNMKDDYTNKVIMSSLGSVEKSIGFKARIVTKGPVNISGLSVDTP